MRKSWLIIGLLLIPVAAALAGDANGDGTVDILDLVVAVNCMNENCQGTPDQNSDNIVDILDLVVIVNNLGNTASCTPSQEVCDGKDNDCDMQVDEGCGQSFDYAISYSTYIGGNNFEEVREPTLLPNGRLLFGMRAMSGTDNRIVTPGTYMTSRPGGQGDSYLGILRSDGTLEAGTYFGGSGMERPPYGIAVMSNGDITFVSGTGSTDIPTTPGTWRRSRTNNNNDVADGYMCRISQDLKTMKWCTYLGAWPRGGIGLDNQDNIMVVGSNAATDFQATAGSFQPSGAHGSGFAIKMRPDGSGPVWSSYMGSGDSSLSATKETGLGIMEDPDGDVIITGLLRTDRFFGGPPVGVADTYAIKVSGDGRNIIWQSRIDGNGADGSQHRHVILPDGSLIIAAGTDSTNLPKVKNSNNGGRDGMVAKFDPNGNLLWTRYVGGPGDEEFKGPEVDSTGNIYLFGTTTSNIQMSPNAVDGTYGGGGDGVIFILDPNGDNVLYSTYIGGNQHDLIRGIAVTPNGDIYLGGRTDSNDLPIKNALQTNYSGGTDGFVMKLSRN